MPTELRQIEVHDNRRMPVCLYDMDVDDLPLTVYEFRAYMRIVRRASGGQSACTESLENMALACQMSRPTMVRAIKTLLQYKMIRRTAKSGHTSIYSLCDKSEWQVGGKPQNHQVVNHRTTPGKPQNQGVVNHRTTKNTKEEYKKENKEERAEPPVIVAVPAPAIPHTQDPVEIANEILGTLPIYLQEQIDAAGITKTHLWRQVCQEWRDCRYSLRNIPGLINRYQRAEVQEARDKDFTHGTNGQRTYKTAGERAAESTINLLRKLTDGSNGDVNTELPGFEWVASLTGGGFSNDLTNLDGRSEEHPRQLTQGKF